MTTCRAVALREGWHAPGDEQEIDHPARDDLAGLTRPERGCFFHVMKVADIPQLRSRSVADKLQIVGELWDEIIRQPENVPIPEWHVRELEQDYAAYQAEPREGKPWAKVKARILRRK